LIWLIDMSGTQGIVGPANGSKAREIIHVPSKARARLLAKVYEIDVFRCPQCGSRMSVVAVIRDPESIREIVACLEKKGRGPPQPVLRGNPNMSHS
jgi:hypothetical protein